ANSLQPGRVAEMEGSYVARVDDNLLPTLGPEQRGRVRASIAPGIAGFEPRILPPRLPQTSLPASSGTKLNCTLMACRASDHSNSRKSRRRGLAARLRHSTSMPRMAIR